MAQPSQRITIPGRDDLRDISATPGGTIWATTPGGTRIGTLPSASPPIARSRCTTPFSAALATPLLRSALRSLPLAARSFADAAAAYNRDALLFMRNSPHSKTPPVGMHAIPGVTIGVAAKPENGKPKPTPAPRPEGGDEALFDMDS